MANKDFLKISEDVMENVKKIQNGVDIEHNFEVVSSKFMPIINGLVKKTISPSSIDTNDLVQEGLISLWKCCNNYDFNSSSSFYTYYCSTAIKAMFNFVYSFQHPITVNKHELERTKAIKKFAKIYYSFNDKYPTVEELIDAGFDKNIAKRFTASSEWCFISDKDYIASIQDTEMDIEKIAEDNIEKSMLLKAMNELDEKYRRVLYLRYFEGNTYNEIKEKEGISITCARIYEQKGIQALRDSLNGSVPL